MKSSILVLVACLQAAAGILLFAEEPDPLLVHVNESWTGDLEGMVERGFVRVLTVHNPLFFTFDGPRQRGIIADLARAFEEHLAAQLGRVRSPTVVLIPVARDRLLQALVEGRGDIAAANLTITPERRRMVDFSTPLYTAVSELIVTGPAAPDVTSFDDLAGNGVRVRRSSSYFGHLEALNAARVKRGSPPIPVEPADEHLEDYDLLDLVNAGVIPAVVVDSHKADLWRQVFPRIEVHEDLAVRHDNRIGWAVRKNSPDLMASVNAFAKTVRRGTLLGNIVLERYLGDPDRIEDMLSQEPLERHREIIDLIKRYAGQYDLDWIMVVAQAYQESGLDQDRRSPSGAVGIMQLLPGTAAGPAVGIDDISTVEKNIHAGVRYLSWLRDTYFSSDEIEPLDRLLFSLAAYNAGAGSVAHARQRARQLGFDPDRWFGHAEIGMYRAVSGQPAAYVRKIYKYYVTYREMEAVRARQEEARREIR